MKESLEGELSNSRPDQPRIIDTHSKTKECVELRFIDKQSLKLLRVNKDILKENNKFCYEPKRNVIYINLFLDHNYHQVNL